MSKYIVKRIGIDNISYIKSFDIYNEAKDFVKENYEPQFEYNVYTGMKVWRNKDNHMDFIQITVDKK